MAKKNIKPLIDINYTDETLDPEKAKAVAGKLDRKSLKQFLRALKESEKEKNIYVDVPFGDKDKYINELKSLFPDKKLVVREDPSLLLGLRVTQGDNVLEMNLQHELEELSQFVNEDNPSSGQKNKIDGEDLLAQLEKQLSSFNVDIQEEHFGIVEKNNDGVITASGLSDVSMGEIVTFAGGSRGFVLNLSEDYASIILLDNKTDIKEGDIIKRTETLLSIPVSDEILGRIVNPIGKPLDRNPAIKNGKNMPLEKIAAGVVDREPVNTPMKTGIKAIDSMLPIGRGQRELIIGDRGLGKTAIAIDAIINQKSLHDLQKKNAKSKATVKGLQPMICVYVAIGQKQSSVAQIINTLQEKGAMEYTIVVTSSSSDPAALQYLAPYAGTAIAEYFMEKGKDVLIVYDDLTKHAWSYRQLSLILQRPAGREAYPGDIFYLHSRLLERSVRLNADNGGGSITAIPIIETQASDMSAYIPTNVISITDGQIYLEPSLFNIGVRPAINPGNSVSRVGGAAQTKAIKAVSGKLRLELAQYNSLAAFAQFGSELDESTLKQLERGKRIVEILKQKQLSPLPEAFEILSIWSVTNGYLDDIPVEQVEEFETQLHQHVSNRNEKLINTLSSGEKLSDETNKELKEIIEQFKKGFK